MVTTITPGLTVSLSYPHTSSYFKKWLLQAVTITDSHIATSKYIVPHTVFRILEVLLTHVRNKIQKATTEGNIVDPLVYYSGHGKDIPILTRIASQVFKAEANYGETERIGSDAGIYYSSYRSRLKRETVKKMLYLQGCFLPEMPQLSRRAKVPGWLTRE